MSYFFILCFSHEPLHAMNVKRNLYNSCFSNCFPNTFSSYPTPAINNDRSLILIFPGHSLNCLFFRWRKVNIFMKEWLPSTLIVSLFTYHFISCYPSLELCYGLLCSFKDIPLLNYSDNMKIQLLYMHFHGKQKILLIVCSYSMQHSFIQL